jgi:adenosylmethionine-8-amino-7-oxononanoate aminotransferase
MGGIEIVKNKDTKESFDYKLAVGAKLCDVMRNKGTMMRPLGDVIVLMPAVAMDLETLEKLLGIVSDTIENDLPKIVEEL